MKTKDLTLCAVMAAVECVCAMISIPIGLIHVTLGVMGVLLGSVILGCKRGTIATALFVGIGLAGIPVFGGMGLGGGIAMLAGPTGGYIYSYIFMALITGFAADRLYGCQNKKIRWVGIFAACIVSVAVCYMLGTVQFMAVMDRSVKESLAACVVPFIPFDIMKSIVATGLGITVRKAVRL